MTWLARGHALAGIARRRCLTDHAALSDGSRLGRVACGQCWETVIRADAALAAEFELPAETPEPDLSYVDPVALERALAGERVQLTRAERAELVRRAYAGEISWRVLTRAGISGATAQHLAPVAGPAVPAAVEAVAS